MINKFIAYFNLALSAFNLQFRWTVFSFYLSLRLFRSPTIGIFVQKIAWYYHKTGYPSPFHFWHSWPMKVMSTQIWTRNVLIMKFYFAMIGIWKSVSYILQKNKKKRSKTMANYSRDEVKTRTLRLNAFILVLFVFWWNYLFRKPKHTNRCLHIINIVRYSTIFVI